jgi:hypothetical protein
VQSPRGYQNWRDEWIARRLQLHMTCTCTCTCPCPCEGHVMYMWVRLSQRSETWMVAFIVVDVFF